MTGLVVFIGIFCQIVLSTAFTKEDCSKPVQSMACGAFTPVYHWNEATQKCESTLYGGCHPTSNNFRTKAKCEEVAKPICRDREVGPFATEDCTKDVQKWPAKCLAGIRIYKWDHKKQMCVGAVYGGCRSTKNNFRTLEQCRKIATPVCKKNFHPRVFKPEDCHKDVEEGPTRCEAHIPVYKWDQKEQTCTKAFFGGCHATHNNFKTKKECMEFAKPVCKTKDVDNVFAPEDCKKDVEEGPMKCKALISVFKWDDKEQKCVQAFYGGCHATHNNFNTEDDCQKYAKPICKKSQPKSIFLPEDCKKDVEEGPVTCDALIPVFKWDDDSQKCVDAVYGGCFSTHNNFRSKEDCQKYAEPVCQKQM